MPYDYSLHVVLIGNSGVGKSSLLLRFIENRFTSVYNQTIGAEFGNKQLYINKKSVKLQIWDTSGDERFKPAIRGFCRNANIIIFLFDATNRKSFNNITTWLKDVNEQCSEDAIKILVGNKYDLKNDVQVSIEEAEAFAKDSEYAFDAFFPVSVKNNSNIQALFLTSTEKALKKFSDEQPLLIDSDSNEKSATIMKEALRKEYRSHASIFSIRYFTLFHSYSPKTTDEIIEDLKQRARANDEGASANTLRNFGISLL